MLTLMQHKTKFNLKYFSITYFKQPIELALITFYLTFVFTFCTSIKLKVLFSQYESFMTCFNLPFLGRNNFVKYLKILYADYITTEKTQEGVNICFNSRLASLLTQIQQEILTNINLMNL